MAAVLGIEQLKRLDHTIKKRNENHKLYIKLLRGDIFFKDFNLKGSSNYGLHLILKKPKQYLFKKVLNLLKA